MPSPQYFDLLPLCGCSACAAQTAAEGDAAAALAAAVRPVHDLDPSSPDSGLVGQDYEGKPVWSVEQVVQNLTRSGADWTQYVQNMQVSYWFPTDQDLAGTDFDGFDAAEQAAAHRAMEYYADISGLSFVQADSLEDANLIFRNTNSELGGGYAYYPNASPNPEHHTVNIGHYAPENDGIAEGQYRFRLLLHELGHSLGLAHPGDYNGGGFDYDTHAQYWNDSLQYTNMSYWSEFYTGAYFGDAGTPLLHDVAAIQALYGANHDTRSGTTIYGFNSNARRDAYDLSTDGRKAFTIWDGGGKDTLDFSGYRGSTEIDLRQGAFSSGAGVDFNVSIAYGVTIEKAIGGSARDSISGNEVQNILRGGDGNDRLFGLEGRDHLFGDAGDDRLEGGLGNDTLYGGGGADVLDGGEGLDRASYRYAEDRVTADLEAPDGNRGEAAGDSYVSIERLYGSRHSDVLRGDAANNLIWGDAGNDRLIGRDGRDKLKGMDGDDRLIGGADRDNLYGGDGADRFEFWRGDGRDVVRDFEDGADLLVFYRLGFEDLVFTQINRDVEVAYTETDWVKIKNIDLAQVGEDDFLFL